MNANPTVDHYGVHWDSAKVAWLEQGRAGANALGLAQRSPFNVRARPRHCNHQINLATPIPHDSHWDIFLRVQEDALVRAMMPFPKPDAGGYFLEERAELDRWAVMLSRMSSPIFPIVVPIGSLPSASAVAEELARTNVQPLVLTGANSEHNALIREVAQMAIHRPRKLIVIGGRDVVPPLAMKRITTNLMEKHDFNELSIIHWEALGATALRKWMRREWANEKTTLRNPERTPNA